MKKLLFVFIFLFCVLIITSCGGSENPNEPISTRTTINITLWISAILLLLVLRPTKGVSRLLVIISLVAILISIVFYWRTNQFPSELTEIELWASSLDVGLAHAVVSFTLIVGIILILFIPFAIIASGLTAASSTNEPSGCLSLIAILLYVAGVIFSYKFLMIDTVDLQTILFGEFDRALGWNLPTTFRFSNLVNQINSLYGQASANPEISPVLGSITASLTFVLGLGGVFGIFELFHKLFKK